MAMRTTVLFGWAALLMMAPAFATTTPRDDHDEFAKQMQGTYTIDKGQRGERRLSGDELKGTVKVDKDRFCLLDSEGNELYVVRYKIDEVLNQTAKLSMETVESKEEDAVGSKGKALATLNPEEGNLTIIYDTEGEEYPDDFTPENDDQHVFVLKKKDASD
ncbi:hypothetical protein BH23PLA1_BH23PLA1_21390 [soil metagenome]